MESRINSFYHVTITIHRTFSFFYYKFRLVNYLRIGIITSTNNYGIRICTRICLASINFNI